MNVTILACALAAAFAGSSACRSAPPAALAGRQAPQEVELGDPLATRARFQLFLPRDYAPSTSRRWPLMVFLHGAGERGDDLSRVLVHGPPAWAATHPDFPFVLISPQCPAGDTWRVPELQALLDYALEHYAVDPDRVVLTGISMGGFGAWRWALDHPERFAAVAPICGGGTPIQALLYADSRRGRALRALPFWAFHGERDTVVVPQESTRMVETLRAAGCSVELTLYPDVGHDAWVRAYADPRLFEWMGVQRRKPIGD